MADEYEKETAGFWKQFPPIIVEKFKESVSGLVLDLGSGPGRDALILQEAGLKVVCLDAAEAMVKITKQRSLLSVQADFMKIPFPEETFAGVWAYTSLIHLPKKQFPDALLEAKRVLGRGGVFGIGVIEGETEGYSYSAGTNRPRYFAYYTIDEMEFVLKSHGLEVFYFEQFKPKERNYLNFLARKVV